MSCLLWKYFLEGNVDRFEGLLASGCPNSHHASKGRGGAGQSGSLGSHVGSPATGFGISPRTPKLKKPSGCGGSLSSTRAQANALNRGDLNSRDQSGQTILHRAVSSIGENARAFAMALIEHPMVDLYIQDRENGWTALHRALYFGNVTVARALMDRDSRDSIGQVARNSVPKTNSLVMIKDHEGNCAFDVYNATVHNATVPRRTRQHRHPAADSSHEEEEDESSVFTGAGDDNSEGCDNIYGDEVFAFGSNKNLTLGFGDGDDRQHPERIVLKRPDHLLFRFYDDYLSLKARPDGESRVEPAKSFVKTVWELPSLIRNPPIIIKDVVLSKLHSAILTNDPESNLYMCGIGPGGRLGMGDEATRFNYVCVEGGGLAGKKITAVALGQNHSIAVSSEGALFTWGTNTWGQLGYNLPRPVVTDQDPINPTPRQVFGPLKKEIIVGVAASAIHSVACTSASLYTFGKNEGQLGLMDSDSRSLESQTVPRRVAASLFTAQIQRVSAIRRATICLLANHAVYVFTNYGYNNVKFPIYDIFANRELNNTALISRRQAEPGHISTINSGGDTIAAISSRGDLFTIKVSQKLDSGITATSTTNPTKIRNALSKPQRVWSLRKGHWDGVKSVAVSEDGSVILCTQAGAVWQRLKRIKIKDTHLSPCEFKNKDFRFQRVPGLTNVVAVRSNFFGGYAAIRRDCDIMPQIQVSEPRLWNDISLLFSLRELGTTGSTGQKEHGGPMLSMPIFQMEYLDRLKMVVLTCQDLENDILRHIRNGDNIGYDVDVSTSLSNASIPAHGFMLTARSPVLREALHEFRKSGVLITPDLIVSSASNKLRLQFQGFDFITIFNILLYIYSDNVVDVWNFTRDVPISAFRFRQIRTELIRLALKLGMNKLESAVRQMSQPERRLDIDMKTALSDPKFFENGDIVIQLENGEIIVHSYLMCQRCPFFNALFKGRAAGRWLDSRRNEGSEPVKVDMKHIDSSTFDIVLQYLYADTGTELFDSVCTTDIDEFCDIVMNVVSVANELMLDRLSQICQQVIGRFDLPGASLRNSNNDLVTSRNICHLINALAPCSVTEFKDVGLKYLCLQLETMLENRLLDDLEEDLLLELDEVVRANQLVCLPFAKSGKMDLLLHERHPNLAQEIEEEREQGIRDMAFRSNLKGEDNGLSVSFRMLVGSFEDASTSPCQDKLSRKLNISRNAPFSPSIRPQDSATDLMFDMDKDSVSLGISASPIQKDVNWASGIPADVTRFKSDEKWHDLKGKAKLPVGDSPASSPSLTWHAPTSQKETASLPGVSKPWQLPAIPFSKVDMQDIMAQASMGRESSLSLGLSASRSNGELITPAISAATPRISQKERKKQKKQALQQAIPHSQPVTNKPSLEDKTSLPWRVLDNGAKMSLKDASGPEKSSPLAKAVQLSSSSTPPLDLNYRRAASPDTRFAGQPRGLNSLHSVSKASPISSSLKTDSFKPPEQPQPPKSTPLAPHSKSYANTARKSELSSQFTMADIIGQQKREQDLIKEAGAKRSLHDIQEEQAFQEWWDKESRKAQAEEARRNASSTDLASGRAEGKTDGKDERPERRKGRDSVAHGEGRRGKRRGERKGNDG